MTDTTNEIVDQRVTLYGDPVDTYTRIAQVWSGILGHDINPCEVPLLMAGLKLVRSQVSPDYSDNSDDVDGYMNIFRQVVGEDMIHARTPQEYWAQRETGEGLAMASLSVVQHMPQCRVCGEEEAFHNPTTLACVRPGYDGSWTPTP